MWIINMSYQVGNMMSDKPLTALGLLFLFLWTTPCGAQTTPDPQSEDTVLHIMVLGPYGFPNYKFPFGPEMAGGGVVSAFGRIKAEQLLPGYELNVTYVNSGCNSVKGLGEAHEALRNQKFSAIIGPSCSNVCRHVARLASFLNIPCFTGVCQGTEMIEKEEFQTLTRFVGTFEMTGFAVTAILERFEWKRVGIIAQGQPKDIMWMLTKNGQEAAMKESNIYIAISTLWSPHITDEVPLEEVLLKTKEVSRIIIVAMDAYQTRELLLLAHKHNLLNGDYIFISVIFYKQIRLYGNFDWNWGDSNDEIIKKAYSSVFFVQYFLRKSTEEYTKYVTDVKAYAKDTFDFDYGEDEEVPFEAANVYEATYLFGVAMNETLEENGDITNGANISQRLWGREFDSLTGNMVLNSNGDREQAYTIRHMHKHADGTSNVSTVALYFSNTKDLIWEVTESDLVWPGSKGPPLDRPPCDYDGHLCEDDWLRNMMIIFAVLFVSIILLVGGGGYYGYRKMMWAKDVAFMRWKLEEDDVTMDKKDMRFSVLSLKQTQSEVTDGKKGGQRFTQTAMYSSQRVVVKAIKHVTTVNLKDQAFLTEMKQLHDLSHTNIARMVGALILMNEVSLITEYCDKGSLQDLLENDSISLEWDFKSSIVNDILQGMGYLNHGFIKCHGNLKSSNCVVDGRFVVKLTDFGPFAWIVPPTCEDKDLLWTAPELLSPNGHRLPRRTQAADMYSLGIIMQEIVLREGPFYVRDEMYEPSEVLQKVMAHSNPPFRPSIDSEDCPGPVASIMAECWSDSPADRPSTGAVQQVMRQCDPGNQGMNIMDSLLKRMEQYANNLEGLVEERTSKYLEEKKRSEDLLMRLLPKTIVTELQQRGYVEPESYDTVTIYFSDIVMFTKLCSESTPMQVVAMLNDLYTLFDETISHFDVYKVETIGDAYMVVSGLPERNGDLHCDQIAKMSLRLLDVVNKFKIRHRPDQQLMLRIGLHSGPCVAAVVGLTMPRYCLFGDTVNMAARMESNGEPLRIHCSEQFYEILNSTGGFTLEFRGLIPIKGKGDLATYWLNDGPMSN